MKKLLALLILFLPALANAQQPPSNVFGLDILNNNAQGVSAAGHARIRYNSVSGVLEISYAGAAYTTMVPAAETLAQTYAVGTSSVSSTMLLDATRGALILKDAASTIGTLLDIQNNGATTDYLLISGNATQVIRSAQANGVGNVGTRIDTTTAFSTGKMLQIMSNGSERFSFQLAQMNFPANTIFAVLGGATANTTAVLFTTNVAAGATSTAFRINNTTALTTGQLLQVGDAGVARFQIRPISTDGFQITDSTGTTSYLNVTTNGGTLLCYGAACYAAGNASLTLTDGTANWSMQSGVLTGPRLQMQPASSAQTAALQAWRDSAGNGHYGVDASGFPSLGNRFEWREDFMWFGGSLAAGTAITTIPNSAGVWAWSSSANATGFIASTGISTGSPISTGWHLGSGTANTNNSYLRMTTNIFQPQELNNLYYIAEWNMALTAVGANGFTIKVGTTSSATTIAAANPLGYYFQKANGDTNWQCVTDAGAGNTTTTSSGVPPVANAEQAFRMEYYGSGSVLGAKTVKFYIDNALVCTNTTNVYSAAGLWFNMSIAATAAITQQFVNGGPIMQMYNQSASPLIP